MSGIELGQVAGLDGVVIRRPFAEGLATDAADLAALDVRGKAVLVHTGWDAHWRSSAYFDDHPYLNAAAAEALAAGGAALVGIDSHNIDDTRERRRPVHTILLGAGVLVCEHLTNLAALPDSGFRFSAVPPKFSGVGTFPVRAFAELAG